MTIRLLPYGPRGVLLECAADHVMAVAARLRPVDGVLHLVPGARTVLVEHDGRTGIESTIADAARAPSAGSDLDRLRHIGQLVEIPVRYDGEDLASVATACGLTIEAVVSLHTSVELTSAFCGFAPGFAYLVGLPPPLAAIGRRAIPRTRVPAGSVAVAGGYGAVYPSASPGGWHLLGHTDTPMWDLSAEVPALLAPGTRVRFVEVRP